MIGIFIDTLVICTASAMLILLAGNGTTYMPLEGIQLIQKAMRVLMGSWGAEFVTLVVILFAFSSIVANYIYAENNFFFLRLNNPKAIWCLRICTFATVIGGTLLSFPLMWQLADIIMACMAITNLTAILLLSPVVHTIASDYLRQRKLGVRRCLIRCVIRRSVASFLQTRGMMFRRSNHNYRSTHSLFLLKSA